MEENIGKQKWKKEDKEAGNKERKGKEKERRVRTQDYIKKSRKQWRKI